MFYINIRVFREVLILELNKVQSRFNNVEHKKSKQLPQAEIEEFDCSQSPSNPEYYKNCKGISFKGHPFVDDVKSTERTKNVKLDDENFTIKSYKKEDKDYILTDDGTLYWLRYSKNKDKNAQTVLASKLYNLAGVKTPDMRVYETEHGMNGYVSEYTGGESAESNPQALYDAFAADAWLGNWNTYNHGNTVLGTDGNVVKLVTAGSLEYRASGKKKDSFDSEVTELKTMREPSTNPQGAGLLKDMSDDDLKASLEKVANIKKNDIILAVNQSQVEDKQKMIDTLLARQEYIKNELDKLNMPPEDTVTEDFEADKKEIHSFTNDSQRGVELSDVEKVTPDIRARRRMQLNNYLNGYYISEDDDFSRYQKHDVEKVKQALLLHPEKREAFEDILDVSFWEYKGRRDLYYTHNLGCFADVPEDKLKTVAHLATFKNQGYILPINEPYDYKKLNDIPTDKLNYIVYNCHLKTIDSILEMNKKSFDDIKYAKNLSKKYDIPDNLANNIIKFATDENGGIPRYKKDAMHALLKKSDVFKKGYGSYYGGGPTCLLSSVLKCCDSEEKTDYILNTVMPKYEKVVSEYDQNSQYDVANLSKDGADFDLEMDKIKYFRDNNYTYDYEFKVNSHITTREELDIHKDCTSSGMSDHDAMQTLFHSDHYNFETKEKTYDHDSINFAKEIYKSNLHKVNLFNDYLIDYNYHPERRELIKNDVEKIKERGLTDIIIIDRNPPVNQSYCANPNNKRHLLKEEVEILKDVPLEKMDKIKSLFDIPERKSRQFTIDELIVLSDIDEQANGTIQKHGLYNSTLSADQVITLANMQESTLAEMDKRGLTKLFTIKRENESYSEIAGYFNGFNKSDWNKAESRYFKNDNIPNTGHSVSLEQFKSLLNLDDKTYNDILSRNLFNKCCFDTIFQYIDLVEYNSASDISDLSSAQKRTLLKKLVKYNRDLFGNELNPPIIPRSQKEYCATMNNLVNSIGLNAKPISDEVKADYYDALDSLENIYGEFMNTDFTEVGAKLELKYSKAEFLKDIEKYLSRLSERDRAKVTNYFGFEYKQYPDGSRKMNGYPFNNEKEVFRNPEYNAQVSATIEGIRTFVKNFSEENEIVPNDTISPTLAKELNKITKAFPELNTIIGKEQHKTHSYTVDIHSLNVLQNIMKNPRYRYLPDSDRHALQTVALFHDLTKLENAVDKTLPDFSAFDTYHLIKKLGMSEERNLQIYQLIKNHDFNEKYTPSNAQDYAYELRQGNNFLMECIMSEADLKAVDRGETFYSRYGGKLKDAEANVSKLVDHIQKTAICLPQTKIPKASELRVDGNIVQEEISYDSNGERIRNKVIYLKPNINLKDIGFKEDTKVEDFNVLVHGLDHGEQSAIFNALGQVDSNALLSTSYVNYGKNNYHVFRQQGFILDVAGDDIGAGYYHDFGSGYGKNLNALKKDYIFGTTMNDYRNYMSDCLKKELSISDEEYKKLYPSISDKSITELDKTHPDVAKAIRNVINNMDEGKRKYGRQYNEMLVARPKIQAVFYQGTKGKGSQKYDYESIPVFLREYAAKNDVPIIYFGE